jgi:acetoin utilization protein AcuB
VRDIITVAPDTPVEEAAKLLYTNRIGCVPVMEDDVMIGILTETDLLRSFVQLFGSRDTTSRIEVRMPNKPGELARVVRLIGIENRVNICGMVVPPVTGAESIAIMHLQTGEPRRIIESLRKMGYAVGLTALDIDPDSESGSNGAPLEHDVGVTVEL